MGCYAGLHIEGCCDRCSRYQNPGRQRSYSTKIIQTSADTFDVQGTFTLRGISKPEALTFTVNRDAGGDTGEIKGILSINRNDYGLGGGIRFVTIADRVDVTIAFNAKRVGPALLFNH